MPRGMEWKKYTIQNVDETLVALRTTAEGLPEAEVKRRALEYGKNTVNENTSFVLRVIKRRLVSYFFWLLLAVGVLTFALGERFEPALIAIFLLFNTLLEGYQEFHAEKAARLLSHYLVSRVRVRREGKIQEIDAWSLVPGDIIFFKTGDRIPADARLLVSKSVLVDESLISGESVAVAKQETSLKRLPQEMYGAKNILFAGTSIVTGNGEAVIIATGKNTALGDIAHLTASIEKETQFEKDIRRFSAFLLKMLFGTLVLLYFFFFLTHGNSIEWIPVLVFTLALAVTVLPEALPAITTITLSRGAILLAKKKVIVKRLSAIEDLGSIQILCTDKTGTLTENQLQVSSFWGEHTQVLLKEALLAAQAQPRSREVLHDTFDQALWEEAGAALQTAVSKTERLDELAFNPTTRVNVVLVNEGGKQKIIVRGAPEVILQKVVGLDAFTRNAIYQWIKERGLRGERVLAIATKPETHTHQGLHLEGDLMLSGLISFLDPIKSTTKDTIVAAKKLGVQIKIFSGDSREVVGAVAYAVGLIADPEAVITGSELETYPLVKQIETLEQQVAFARVTPQQKYAYIKLLQKSHTVGFLGEGINDAPALKLAHVAMVVEGASDIARESADILLLTKDLKVIVEGIKEGRKVFENVLKYLKITLASSLGNFYSVALATLILPFLPLLPLQILFLNLLSDFPMLAIATDTVDESNLKRPNSQSIQALLITAVLFGAMSSLFDLAVFRIFLSEGASTLQTAWFIFSVLTEIFLIFCLRSQKWFFRVVAPSKLLFFLCLPVIGITYLLPYTFLGAKLGFVPLAPRTLLLLTGLAILYFIVTEVLKHWYATHQQAFSGERRRKKGAEE